jgi:2-polyprenyl-6-methoxyphenol hydroxylase-like FAD-dependent oxidoreductase
MHVLIIGGGIGGLCLAQGLRRRGVSVAVYERDRTPDARLQGYRLCGAVGPLRRAVFSD